MGVIKRQGIKHSIVQFAGLGLSAIAMLFIYNLSMFAYGLVQTFIAAASFISPFVLLGGTVIAVKYFPEFKNEEKKHSGFLGIMLLLGLAGFLLFVLLFPLLKPYIIKFFFEKQPKELANQFIFLLIPLVFALAFSRIAALYASNFQRIVIPVILEELLIRITLPILILGYFLQYLGVSDVLMGVFATYAIGCIGLFFYIRKLGQFYIKPRFEDYTRPKIWEMARYGGYGMLSGLGTKTAFYIDTLMVSALMEFSDTGVYAISLFMANTIGQPIRSIIGIAQPIISKAFSENNLKEIKTIYQKSSLNLLILGIFLFLGIWSNLDDLFQIMPNTEPMKAGKWVVFFLCLAKLSDMATSVNNEVINYSKYYYYNFIAILGLGVFNVLCNLYLIPKYQIVGAAMATFISLTLFNIIKLIIIYVKFGFQPFSWKTLLLIGLGGLVYGIIWILPAYGHPVVDIIIRSGLIVAVYPLLVYKLNISEDYNSLLFDLIEKYAPFLKFLLK
ncbi:MAG: polysaccharide biosynthesis C-terminal domain-containing protein [Saprospiraceae bacterium]|nr:polysaccharide biosynthesis C-terminal domain-containing protein [Saprospiraceae bacterium]